MLISPPVVRRNLYLFPIILLAALTLGCDSASSPNKMFSKAPTATPDAGVAVVELFTSEGCSSCPPAEELLGRIDAAATRNGRPIFALAFHVDYWNQSGWSDPFSSHAFTDRQMQYIRRFKLDEIYTPEMIVNGRTEFVGSDQAMAEKTIDAALAIPSLLKVTASITKDSTGQFHIQFNATPETAGVSINVAVVERGLGSRITAGENAGMELHDPVAVRWFSSPPLAARGIGEAVIPALPQVHLDHASVIVYAQRDSDWSILGATALQFP